MTPRRIAAIAALLFLATLFALSQWRNAHASLHRDEVEYLHAAWRMAHGDRLYADFVEHHSPLFFATLLPLAPAGNTIPEIQAYVVRARLLYALFTVIALSAAAVVVWRTSGRPLAAIVFLGLVFAAGPIWRNGLGDVRADALGLALWWCGAALVLFSKRDTLRGVGIGLAFIAALANPKWPLASIILAGAFLFCHPERERGTWADGATHPRALQSILAAITTSLLGLLAILPFTDLPRFAFFTFRLSGAISSFVRAHAGQPHTFWGCPPLVRPLLVLFAAVLVALAFRRNRAVLALLALAAASLAEVRFVYPFPAVDFRYYAFWVVIAAMLLALAPFAAAELLRRHTSFARLADAIPAVCTGLALVAAIGIVPLAAAPRDAYWLSTPWLQARVGPADTVWIPPARHPIGMRDATYYWFGFGDLIPAAMQLRTTTALLPALAESDLPPCRLDPSVRFLPDVGEYQFLPAVRRCFVRLQSEGRVERTLVPGVWRVR